MTATEALWLTDRSQHSSCDSAFANWRKRGGLTPSLRGNDLNSLCLPVSAGSLTT